MKPLITLTLIASFLLMALPAHAQNATPPAPRKTAATAKPFKPRVMVALVFGQSNAGNWGESPLTAGPNVFNFFRGEFGRARDPLRGANGNWGSVWTRLGDKIIAAKLYDRVVFVPASIGATEIALWSPGGLLHKDLLRNVREAKDAGYTFTHLLWHQGESDAVLGTRKEDYEQRFIEMLAAIRALGVDAPAFVAVATRCGDYQPNLQIRAAQMELVNPALGIFQGPDTDELDLSYRHDGCHFSNAGLDAHAEMWLNVIEDHAQLIAAKSRP
jgi:hypothetical protein